MAFCLDKLAIISFENSPPVILPILDFTYNRQLLKDLAHVNSLVINRTSRIIKRFVDVIVAGLIPITTIRHFCSTFAILMIFKSNFVNLTCI